MKKFPIWKAKFWCSLLHMSFFITIAFLFVWLASVSLWNSGIAFHQVCFICMCLLCCCVFQIFDSFTNFDFQPYMKTVLEVAVWPQVSDVFVPCALMYSLALDFGLACSENLPSVIPFCFSYTSNPEPVVSKVEGNVPLFVHELLGFHASWTVVNIFLSLSSSAECVTHRMLGSSHPTDEVAPGMESSATVSS